MAPTKEIGIDPQDTEHDFHLMSSTAALTTVGGNEATSTQAKVDEQRTKYGSNQLAEAHGRPLIAIIFSNFVNAITAILAAVLILAVIIEEWIEAVVVILIILLNSCISIIQEYQSEKSMAAIQHLGGATKAIVIRGGQAKSVGLGEVVVGDIVDLHQGDVVPADLRMIEINRLEIDEAVLTGESVPVTKTTDVLSPGEEGEVAVGDRINMAFRQTSVTQGSGKGVVVVVGKNTQIGKIAERLAKRGVQKKTALTLTMERLMYLLVLIGIVFGILIFWAFRWDVSDAALLYASATLVAILPEAAIVLITVTMAISARRMAKSNAIVRKMTALEQLGKVTDICSDKTGTLTEGKMRPAQLVLCGKNGSVLKKLIPEGPAKSRAAKWSPCELSSIPAEESTALDKALRAVVLCSSATLEHTPTDSNKDALEGIGSPTELALLEMAHKALYGINPSDPITFKSIKSNWRSRGIFEFDSKSKTMSTGWCDDKYESLVTVKGAPESILPRCNIPADIHMELTKVLKQLASQGLRVLAVAERGDLDLSHQAASVTNFERPEVETNLCLLALVAVRDPPKASSLIAVRQCFGAGIKVRMLTGDHPDTALAIAREIGILPNTNVPPARGQVLTGPALDALTDKELDAMPDLPIIVARSSPESKVRMVEALHRRKRVVAMTGDGVNDSPAIKEADIGIAMGITGSDVTKGVADIVLADDNFATIVSAVKEGRRIFASISNFVMHLLSGNIAEAVALMVSLSYVTDGEDLPVFVLSPIAILFINTATGSGPAIGLALDGCAPDIMDRPPTKNGIFTNETIMDCFIYGFMMGGLSLTAFSAYLYGRANGNLGVNCNGADGFDCDDVQEARGDAFLTLNTLLLLHAYNCRHQRLSLFAFPLFENRMLWGSVIAGTIITVPLLYAPFLNDEVFKQQGGTWEWGMVFGFGIIFMAFAEFYKYLKRRFLPPLTELVSEIKSDPLESVVSDKTVGTSPTKETTLLLAGTSMPTDAMVSEI